jgi:hypothetical protein
MSTGLFSPGILAPVPIYKTPAGEKIALLGIPFSRQAAY